MSVIEEPYLSPYLRAAERHGAGFASLLWASPATQQTRFQAILSMYDPSDRILLDAGCGRADYLSYLLTLNIRPAWYIGIEGVEALAASAEQKRSAKAKIVRADFVRDPGRLFAGADVVVFSGSLNTMGDAEFYSTLRRAYDAATEAVVFNFLCSSMLAGKDYLHWRHKWDVAECAGQFCKNVSLKDDYLEGDCTVRLMKPHQ